jgi:hypothetical protein
MASMGMSEDLGEVRAQPWRIALVSASVLVLELALIRQIPAEVRIISYFTNLILMSSFFGLGLGMILQGGRRFDLLLPLGLLAVAGFVFWARGLVIFEHATEVHYWLLYEAPEGTATEVPPLLAAIMAFVFSATPFVALGSLLAYEMDRFPRLVAYGWDIAGSLGGTLLFAVSSALQLPPWIWPLLVMVVWVVWFGTGWRLRALGIIAGLCFVGFTNSPHAYHWSPYYYVQHRQEPDGLRVWVNSSFHQFAVDFTRDDTPDARAHVEQVLEKFSTPYQIYRAHHRGAGPKKVLILGAGTGNDVEVAVHNGAEEIVAVEIDPVILQLGQQVNRIEPYADPRVRPVLDDARHFLRTSHEKFDLIVFGTLDSQTLLSGHANIRLENYVYTQEAFAEAGNRLAEGGMIATYYAIFKPWLAGRLYQTICSNFPEQCRIFGMRDYYLFNTLVMAGNGVESFATLPEQRDEFAQSLPSVDDWPFLYIERPTISPLYLWMLAMVSVLIAGVFLIVRRLHGGSESHLNFMFLGVGFTLMEAAAVVRLALLFGSTWTVNAVVFSSVLLMIFVANLLVVRGFAPSLRAAWAGVVAGAALNYFVELPRLFDLPWGLQLLASGLLIGVPVFFAAVCFSRLFAREKSTGYALGINLVGAMAGGFIEYLSMLIGTRAIWGLVAVVYLLALLLTLRSSRSRTPGETVTAPASAAS